MWKHIIFARTCTCDACRAKRGRGRPPKKYLGFRPRIKLIDGKWRLLSVTSTLIAYHLVDSEVENVTKAIAYCERRNALENR